MAGDFVTRGLPVASRQFWDRWLTAHLSFAFGPDVAWPIGGLRVSMAGQVGVILQSRDKAGRYFPLLGLVLHDRGCLAEETGDRWLDALFPGLQEARDGEIDAGALLENLADLSLGAADASDEHDGIIVWASDFGPVTCRIDAPKAALTQVFSAS